MENISAFELQLVFLNTRVEVKQKIEKGNLAEIGHNINEMVQNISL
jgi:hypothetical protein